MAGIAAAAGIGGFGEIGGTGGIGAIAGRILALVVFGMLFVQSWCCSLSRFAVETVSFVVVVDLE